jgi:hypothetical protein
MKELMEKEIARMDSKLYCSTAKVVEGELDTACDALEGELLEGTTEIVQQLLHDYRNAISGLAVPELFRITRNHIREILYTADLPFEDITRQIEDEVDVVQDLEADLPLPQADVLVKKEPE